MLTSLTYANADGTRTAIVERCDSGDALFLWSVTCRDYGQSDHCLTGYLHFCQRIARRWVQQGHPPAGAAPGGRAVSPAHGGRTMMTDQQLQEMEMDFTDDDVSVRDYVAHGKTLIAEVRRVQQQAEQTAILLNNATRLAGEATDQRDAALAERDAARGNYDRACETIALMHAAATGTPGCAPRRGVVEDIADLAAALTEAREMHAAVTEHFESLQKRLSAAEMDRVTLLDILVSGAKPPSFRVRVREAWRVIRGVVNVGDLRQYAYRETKRADDELARHSKTLEYHNAEQAAAGEQIQKLTRDLAQARDERLRVLRAIETQTADRNRELAEADRHAREHIARAEALNKRIQQMEDDAKRELLYWYNPKAEIGCRWVREHQYPPGTVLEKRNAANQAIARSIDGGQTWHEVRETVVMAPENPA